HLPAASNDSLEPARSALRAFAFGKFLSPLPKRLKSHPMGEEQSPVGAAYSLTIAQPFKAGIHRAQSSKSRQGRKVLAHGHHIFCRPSRDSQIYRTIYPAINGWAIFGRCRS